MQRGGAGFLFIPADSDQPFAYCEVAVEWLIPRCGNVRAVDSQLHIMWTTPEQVAESVFTLHTPWHIESELTRRNIGIARFLSPPIDCPRELKGRGWTWRLNNAFNSSPDGNSGGGRTMQPRAQALVDPGVNSPGRTAGGQSRCPSHVEMVPSTCSAEGRSATPI